MLRITSVASGELAGAVKVEGRVAGQVVDELARAVTEALDRLPHVVVDVSDVTFVDHEGAALLKSLRRRGVRLVGCSVFLRSLLNGDCHDEAE